MKVMTILGTRPEIIKLSRVMACLDESVCHIIVNTGQNFDHNLNEDFFRDLEIRNPDYHLDVITIHNNGVSHVAHQYNQSWKVR